MKLKSKTPLLHHRIIQAEVSETHPAGQGLPVLVLENGYAVLPGEAIFVEYEILEADDQEIEGLIQGGYDFVPPQ
jgi:hypothetical protein